MLLQRALQNVKNAGNLVPSGSPLVSMQIDRATYCTLSMCKATWECWEVPSFFDTFPSGPVGRLKELMNKNKSRLMLSNAA